MKHWVDYLITEENKTVFHNDGGLIAGYVTGDEFYVSDIYVVPEQRKTPTCFNLGQEAEEYAKKMGCTKMTSNIFINEANRDMFAYKIGICHKYGFRPVSTGNNAVTMVKQL